MVAAVFGKHGIKDTPAARDTLAAYESRFGSPREAHLQLLGKGHPLLAGGEGGAVHSGSTGASAEELYAQLAAAVGAKARAAW